MLKRVRNTSAKYNNYNNNAIDNINFKSQTKISH